MAIDPNCGQAGKGCRLWVAAAGGGIWRTDDALAAHAALDVRRQRAAHERVRLADRRSQRRQRQHALRGTGEPNGSGDSEAGARPVQVHRRRRHLVARPRHARGRQRPLDRRDRVDPADPNTIWIGTALGRHGQSSVNGGAAHAARTRPPLGVYRSTDGGSHFTLEFRRSGRPRRPAPPGRRDWFQGGVNKIELDPHDPDTRLRRAASATASGARTPAAGGRSATVNQVFATPRPGRHLRRPHRVRPHADRGAHARLRRATPTTTTLGRHHADNVASSGASTTPTSPASALARQRHDERRLDQALRAPPNGDPGFASYKLLPDASAATTTSWRRSPGNPDTVWLGGSMNYDELRSAAARRRARAPTAARSSARPTRAWHLHAT